MGKARFGGLFFGNLKFRVREVSCIMNKDQIVLMESLCLVILRC